MYELKTINGKDVYIFENHNIAIIPWVIIKKKIKDDHLGLLTLDFHPDTNEAFRNYLIRSSNQGSSEKTRENERKNLLDGIDIDKTADLERSVDLLKHDEQIDFAIRKGILDFAQVIQYQGLQEKFSIGEEFPEDRILMIQNFCAVGCSKETHDCSCVIEHSNQAIESILLNDRLLQTKEYLTNIGKQNYLNKPYILDIDLDYFRTKRSINPEDPTAIYKLIRASAGITIAKESECVLQERLAGEVITSEYLLERILEIISTALTKE